MIQYHIFRPGKINSSAAETAAMSLRQLVKCESDNSYARMMAFRLAGEAAAECEDIYFIATESGRCVSRLWFGWGKHAGAVGNFGNFRTADELQGRGIGGRLFTMLAEALCLESKPPLALFCTSDKPHLVRLYGKIGFRPALANAASGPLYCPLAYSPESFAEFRRRYYRPALRLSLRPGTVGRRHEIDCLLNFALRDEGKDTGARPGAFSSFEAAFLAVTENPSLGKLEVLITEDERTVGWSFTPRDGTREMLLHPGFRELPISCDRA